MWPCPCAADLCTEGGKLHKLVELLGQKNPHLAADKHPFPVARRHFFLDFRAEFVCPYMTNTMRGQPIANSTVKPKGSAKDYFARVSMERYYPRKKLTRPESKFGPQVFKLLNNTPAMLDFPAVGTRIPAPNYW